MEKCLLKRGIAECFGTFVLVFLAVGTAVGAGIIGGMFYHSGTYFMNFTMHFSFIAPVALAFGLVIVAMAYTIGRVSGCHINPAVSLGVFLSKKMKIKEFGVYVGFQFLGATIGAALLYGIVAMAFGGNITELLPVWGTNGMISDAGWTAGNIIGSLLIEVVLTCVFVYVILSVTAKKGSPKKAGLIIGLTLTLVHLLGISFTGTSVNPARSFGPAIMALAFGAGTDAIAQFWIFLVAPLAGGALAAVLFKFFHKQEETEEQEELKKLEQ
ncbi:MAG: aquaporin [Firmicutes bacterium]|nr:aquaporin [Bacillota bacterium]